MTLFTDSSNSFRTQRNTTNVYKLHLKLNELCRSVIKLQVEEHNRVIKRKKKKTMSLEAVSAER